MTFDEEFTIKRLRVLAKVLNCENALPDDITALGCLGTCLGLITRHAETLQRKIQTARAEGMEDAARITLTVLGHIKMPNGRCTARYKDAPHVTDGPRNLPVWCDLPVGHEGPHWHVTGHRTFIMDRESLIEMNPLPDVCQKCGTRWPCEDAATALNAIRAAIPSPAGEECCEQTKEK